MSPPSPVRPLLSTLNVDLPSSSFHDQVSPSTSGARSFSQVRLPSFRLSNTGPPKSPPRRSFGFERPSVTHHPDPTQRYRNESRKLLAHILGQLRDRTKPQSVFNAFRSSESHGVESRDLRTAVRAIQGAVKLKAGLSSQERPGAAAQDDNDSDNEGGSFSTDSTFNLLSQFVSALSVAVNAGWQVFDDGYEIAFSCNKCAQSLSPSDSLDGSSAAFPMDATRRSSRSKTRRRSRSASPLRRKLPAPDLLAHSISILASIVAEDCRFQVTTPRPSRPPNALQSVVLDAAGYLLHMNRHNPKVVSQIGFALLPAFYTFRPEMHLKLLTFFDTMVMRPMLESLREAQGIALIKGLSFQIFKLLSGINNNS